MKKHLKLYFLIAVLAVLLSAWTIHTTYAAQSTNNDGGTIVESSQSSQATVPVFETNSGDDSAVGYQNPDELNRILDGVNLAPPVYRPDSSFKIAGPMPGTESGPVNNVVPVPAPSTDSGDTGTDGSSSSSTLGMSIRLIGEWLLALVRSFINA